VRLHCGNELHLLRETMSGMEARLDAEKFIRISRSIIVNLDRLKEIQPLFNGSYLFVLQDGSKVESSRRYRQKLAALFESTA
jgi:two-component system LytT family response regulator